MIGNVNINSAIPWQNVNKQASNNPQTSWFPAPQSGTPTHIQLDGNALVSGGVRIPGGGMMSASVFKRTFQKQNRLNLI